MKLAFVLFHYFPYGGLERDMLAIARNCLARGHVVTIYTQSWEGDKPADIPVRELTVHALTNHGSALAFAEKFRQQALQEAPDLVVGFNKMPGLDVYFAADVCFAQKAHEERGWFYRRSWRCRHYLQLEKAVFDPASHTQVLALTPAQIKAFKQYYHTQDERFHLLPPGIKRDRVMPADYAVRRAELRQSYGLAADAWLMLMVGSDFRRKGVGRSIGALAALPEALRQRARLWVAGLSDPDPFIKQAEALGVRDNLEFLGARDDVPELLWSADLFLHPAYSEAAGAVLLEAMVAGLPVLTTAVCGYAPFVEQQHLGAVLPVDVTDADLAKAIEVLAAQDPQQWRTRAQHFVEHENIFSMTSAVATLIEAGFATSAVA